MAVQILNGKQQFFDGNGVPLAGGFVYMYIPVTTTPKNTWQDEAQSTLNTNPIVLDASGEAVIWGTGLYRQVLTDSLGNEIWDQETGSSANVSSTAYGQCHLVYTSNTEITLRPYNGNLITINSTAQTIPDAGVALSPSGLTPGTIYYIYAYMNSSTMTLEASTTGYVSQTGTGIVIKSGDATRSLVGLAYPVTGPLWAYAAENRLVRSWFHDNGITGSAYFTADHTTTSTSFTEISSGDRANYIVWNNERVHVTISAQVQASTAAALGTAIGVDSTSSASLGFIVVSADVGAQCVARSDNVGVSSTEEFHYLTILGKTSTGTATWNGNNSNTNITYTSQRRTS